jgi:hypothetical protein
MIRYRATAHPFGCGVYFSTFFALFIFSFRFLLVSILQHKFTTIQRLLYYHRLCKPCQYSTFLVQTCMSVNGRQRQTYHEQILRFVATHPQSNFPGWRATFQDAMAFCIAQIDLNSLEDPLDQIIRTAPVSPKDVSTWLFPADCLAEGALLLTRIVRQFLYVPVTKMILDDWTLGGCYDSYQEVVPQTIHSVCTLKKQGTTVQGEGYGRHMNTIIRAGKWQYAPASEFRFQQYAMHENGDWDAIDPDNMPNAEETKKWMIEQGILPLIVFDRNAVRVLGPPSKNPYYTYSVYIMQERKLIQEYVEQQLSQAGSVIPAVLAKMISQYF